MFKILQNKQVVVVCITVFLVFLGALARFLPHSPNFVPIAALALFAACYLPKKWALIVPLGAMFLSDIFIGFYACSGYLLRIKNCFNIFNTLYVSQDIDIQLLFEYLFGNCSGSDSTGS